MFSFKKKKTKQDALKVIIDKAIDSGKKIVLPEGDDDRVVEAAIKASQLKVCKVAIIGNKIILKDKIPKKVLKDIEIIDVQSESKKREMYARSLYELRKEKGMTEEKAFELMKDPMYYATMMLKLDDVDGIVAGAKYESADVMRPALQIIKSKPEVSKVSSCFIMEMPENSTFGENGMMIFADCGLIQNPTDKELAEITIETAKTADTICGIKPRVAMLSYSTKSDPDIEFEDIQKVKRAFKIVRRKDSSLIVDGELQVDAALVPEVAKAKCKGSTLEGKANILIFPTLDAGNIGYKLVQRIAGTRAIGPVLQGLKKPVNDLSRGCTSDEIVIAMAITALQSKISIKGE
ncbi:MAG: phosphate acetyltransferase [Clostridia bacterium]|nr:phosphate acetyltransferase [Clostridia bacterium]